MRKEQVREAIEKKIGSEEKLMSFFIAQKNPPIWSYFLFGPLAVLALRGYLVGLTNLGVHFHKLNLLGKISQHDFFSFAEITSVKIGSGILQIPLTFLFGSGLKLKLKAQKRGLDHIAKIDENALAYISQKVMVIN